MVYGRISNIRVVLRYMGAWGDFTGPSMEVGGDERFSCDYSDDMDIIHIYIYMHSHSTRRSNSNGARNRSVTW